MSLTPWLPLVRRIKDGETVDQATVNVPIDQLTQREQHLYEKFNEISGKSVLLAFAQPIHPEEIPHILPNALTIVYYRNDSQGTGLSRSITGFSSSQSSSMFSPKDSNYSFGITKMVYQSSNTADLYIEGLCEFDVALDDPVRGILQSGEVFAIGPYFLSAKSPGKITRDPAGIPVYVGYAISKTKFLLHTNVDEFSQFFINYRYHLLDRVAGTPQKSNLDIWTISNSNTSKLGWVAAGDSGNPVPEGAVFFYNIPNTSEELEADTELEDYERAEALELRRDLPPVPANFIQLYTNGTLERYNNDYDPDGTFSVNEYGIWWFKNRDGEQPWSSAYLGPILTKTWGEIKTALEDYRMRMFVSFSKFNPALRTQLVRSLSPFDSVDDATGDYVNRPSNFIKFYNKDVPSETSPTGELLVDITPEFDLYGYRPSSATTDAEDFTYPASPRTSSYTANRAVAALKYHKSDGTFKAVITPVVSAIEGRNGISVTEKTPNSGAYIIDYTSKGLIGQVDSIEPINSRLEFIGLTSYIKLPPPSTTPYGLIGKILVPRGYVSSRPLKLTFHLFGDKDIALNSSYRSVAFQFEYSAVATANNLLSSNYTLVNSNKYSPSVNPVEFALVSGSANPNSYTAFTAMKISDDAFTIPASFVREDSIINFKISRVSTALAPNSYAGNLTGGGNIGLLGIYWEILT
jgi:hypothetical protein